MNARCTLHERFSTNPTDLRRWLFDAMLADLPAQARVLELGCGPGDLWLVNRERVPPNWSITLTDASPGMVRGAARRLGDDQPRYQFGVADAETLPFADGSFDAVLAHFMLYHVPDRPRAFAEIRRVLRPDGSLHAATNGRDHLRELRQLTVAAGLSRLDTTATGDAPAFSLENGADQLTRWFDPVTLHRRQDSLAVTAVVPLVAAILSSCEVQATLDQLSDAETEVRITQLSTTLRTAINQHGAVRIRKESGLFIARVRQTTPDAAPMSDQSTIPSRSCRR
ncbi:MAG: class I SAM-dependent methyltransferase [Chloroflexota bacterium]|nr:class I SAM-dependent methyltransferase [Chloroflexota bacterium]